MTLQDKIEQWGRLTTLSRAQLEELAPGAVELHAAGIGHLAIARPHCSKMRRMLPREWELRRFGAFLVELGESLAVRP